MTLHGERMVDEAGFWAEISLCFGFPDYQGSNWDAFHDSFGDRALPARFAVVWRNADTTADRNLKLFAEAIANLAMACQAASVEGRQGELILSGTGEQFGQP